MNKYCLISIRPQHALNILNGSKTIELRKLVLNWVKEEVAKGNTVKFLLYVTKGNRLAKFPNVYKLLNKPKLGWELNGKIVAQFDVSKISGVYYNLTHDRFEPNSNGEDLSKLAHLSNDDISKYFGNKHIKDYGYGYAIHISNLNVFDKPKELSDYYHFETEWVYSGMYSPYFDLVKTILTKAPQNMMTVWGDKL